LTGDLLDPFLINDDSNRLLSSTLGSYFIGDDFLGDYFLGDLEGAPN
jgi:hypothetical protein